MNYFYQLPDEKLSSLRHYHEHAQQLKSFLGLVRRDFWQKQSRSGQPTARLCHLYVDNVDVDRFFTFLSVGRSIWYSAYDYFNSWQQHCQSTVRGRPTYRQLVELVLGESLEKLSETNPFIDMKHILGHLCPRSMYPDEQNRDTSLDGQYFFQRRGLGQSQSNLSSQAGCLVLRTSHYHLRQLSTELERVSKIITAIHQLQGHSLSIQNQWRLKLNSFLVKCPFDFADEAVCRLQRHLKAIHLASSLNTFNYPCLSTQSPFLLTASQTLIRPSPTKIFLRQITDRRPVRWWPSPSTCSSFLDIFYPRHGRQIRTRPKMERLFNFLRSSKIDLFSLLTPDGRSYVDMQRQYDSHPQFINDIVWNKFWPLILYQLVMLKYRALEPDEKKLLMTELSFDDHPPTTRPKPWVIYGDDLTRCIQQATLRLHPVDTSITMTCSSLVKNEVILLPDVLNYHILCQPKNLTLGSYVNSLLSSHPRSPIPEQFNRRPVDEQAYFIGLQSQLCDVLPSDLTALVQSYALEEQPVTNYMVIHGTTGCHQGWCSYDGQTATFLKIKN